MKTEPLVVEQLLNAPIDQVWEAISENSKMRHWYFDIPKFEAVPGFEFEFYGSKDNTRYLHLCKVISVEPDRKLSYSWKYKGYPGESFVTFELFDENGQTRLRLTHDGLETFGIDNRDFARENFNEGWNHIIGTSLRNYVEGQA
jgi:Uncharacterized conserved protein